MKKKNIFRVSAVLLAVLMSVVLALPVAAVNIQLDKHTIAPYPTPYGNVYYYYGPGDPDPDVIHYDFIFTNPSDTNGLHVDWVWDRYPGVAYVDPWLLGSPPPGWVELGANFDIAAGNSWSPAIPVQWTANFTGMAINTIYVKGYEIGTGLPFTGSITEGATVIAPEITIHKLVDFDGIAGFDDVSETNVIHNDATWRIWAENTGDVYLDNVNVWDGMHSWGPFNDVAPGDIIGPTAIGPDFVLEDYVQTDITANTTNTAYVTADDPFDTQVGDQDDASALVINPAVSITKKVNFDDDPDYDDVSETNYSGNNAVWWVMAENTGDAILDNFYMWDGTNNWGPFNNVDPGDTFGPYTYTQYNVTANKTNTAHVTAVPDGGGNTVSDEDDASVVVIPLGTIQVFKYNDLNGDGHFDEGDEPGLSGWQFCIENQGCKTTSLSGFTTEWLLPPGDYRVNETLKDGWENTQPGDHDYIDVNNLEGGQHVTVYFGNHMPLPPPPPPPVGGTVTDESSLGILLPVILAAMAVVLAGAGVWRWNRRRNQ